MCNISEEVISKWSKKYPDFEVVKDIKSGKEASVYLVKIKGELCALKVYKEDHLKASNAEYIAGKHFREKSHARAVAKKTKFGKDLIQKLWTKREFYMLKKFNGAGASVPKVFDYTDNAILMEYLGDENSEAPRLKSIKLSLEDLKKVKDEVMESIQIFLDNGVVHGDLSEFNILYWNNKPYIIDFPQAVDVKRNPNWEEVFERDKKNLEKYFNS